MRRLLAILAFTIALATTSPALAHTRAEEESKWNSVTYADCGNGSTWQCVVRYPSNCYRIDSNGYPTGSGDLWTCERYWTETQFGVHNQNQRGYGRLYGLAVVSHYVQNVA